MNGVKPGKNEGEEEEDKKESKDNDEPPPDGNDPPSGASQDEKKFCSWNRQARDIGAVHRSRLFQDIPWRGDPSVTGRGLNKIFKRSSEALAPYHAKIGEIARVAPKQYR